MVGQSLNNILRNNNNQIERGGGLTKEQILALYRIKMMGNMGSNGPNDYNNVNVGYNTIMSNNNFNMMMNRNGNLKNNSMNKMIGNNNIMNNICGNSNMNIIRNNNYFKGGNIERTKDICQ